VLDLPGHRLGLGAVVLAAPEADRVGLAQLVREFDRLRLRPARAERPQRRLARDSVSAHALRRVAGRGDPAVAAELAQHPQVRAAGVLELVDEQVAEPRRDLVGDVGTIAQ
jgi:hypothetical protein